MRHHTVTAAFDAPREEVFRAWTDPDQVAAWYGPEHFDTQRVRIELRVGGRYELTMVQRGSGTEPLNVISHYKYQDGLAYYESTRDTASHFFIDYLPKGVYVFEYSTRVFHKGAYQSGIAEIQCMYAPEFNSHSESLAIAVN